jgi:hypothetical protein
MRAWLEEHKLIFSILLIGTVSRFWAFWELPFTHDELSALLRSRISSWQEFIDIGIKMDNHPGGVQLLIWVQTMVGGYEAWWIKLPFLIAGVWCIWMIYLVGFRLYSKETGLFSGALIATLQFPISFSQWARPYIVGLLVVLTLTWVLARLLYERKSPWKWIIGFAFLMATSGYIHYFTLLQTILVSFGFFIMLDRAKRLKLLLGGLLGFALWLPHLGLTLFHLERGGIGNWLKAPTADYWQHMLSYTFQFSWWPILLIAIAIIPALLKWKEWFFKLDRWVMVACFTLPFAIGYFYSIGRAPLLHQSVLIFSLPFLLLWLASFVPIQSKRVPIFIGLLMAINVFVLINQRNHYTLNYQSEYGSALDRLAQLKQADPSLVNIIDLRQDFVDMMMETDMTTVDNVQFLAPFMADHSLETYLQSLTSDRIFFAMNVGTDPESFAAVLHHFPCMEEAHYYHAGEAYLLSKNCDSRIELKVRIREEIIKAGAEPYSEAIKVNWGDLSAKSNTHFVLDYSGYAAEASTVVEVKSDLEPLWRGVSINDFYNPTADHQRAYHVLYNSEMKYDGNIELKSFVWLAKGDSLLVNDYRVFRVPMNNNKFRLFYE